MKENYLYESYISLYINMLLWFYFYHQMIFEIVISNGLVHLTLCLPDIINIINVF